MPPKMRRYAVKSTKDDEMRTGPPYPDDHLCLSCMKSLSDGDWLNRSQCCTSCGLTILQAYNISARMLEISERKGFDVLPVLHEIGETRRQRSERLTTRERKSDPYYVALGLMWEAVIREIPEHAQWWVDAKLSRSEKSDVRFSECDGVYTVFQTTYGWGLSHSHRGKEEGDPWEDVFPKPIWCDTYGQAVKKAYEHSQDCAPPPPDSSHDYCRGCELEREPFGFDKDGYPVCEECWDGICHQCWSAELYAYTPDGMPICELCLTPEIQ